MIIEEKITFDKFIRWSLTALVVIVVLLLMNYLSGVLLPFFVAWLLAYLIYPIVKFVQYRLHVPTRVLSIIVSLVFLVAVIGGVFYLIKRGSKSRRRRPTGKTAEGGVTVRGGAYKQHRAHQTKKGIK